MKQNRTSSPARRKMKRLSILLGLLLAVMLTFTLRYQHRIRQPAADIPGETSFLPEAALDAYLSSESGSDIQADPVAIGSRGTRIVNILLIGQDRREDEGRTRSDSMMLCTFNKRTRKLILTSFLRDLYVDIPGYGSSRLNTAYAAGGMTLLDKTLEENFGLEIDGTVEVDFTQFAKIVDLLGGVDMDIREDEAGVINEETGSTLTAGAQRLNGDQALAYSRIRKLDADGDFSRTTRQRKVMGALLDAYRDADLPTLLKLLNNILPMITTDLGGMEIMGYALELFPLLSGVEIQQQHVPTDGTYTDQNIDGMAVLVPDLDAAREMLRSTLMEG